MSKYSTMTDIELLTAMAKLCPKVAKYPMLSCQSITAAWMVMEAAKELGVSFDIHEPAKGTRCVLAFVGDKSFRVTNDNPARAICEAALMAVEVGK